MICLKCGSNKIKKNGKYDNKQKFKCNDCENGFFKDSNLNHPDIKTQNTSSASREESGNYLDLVGKTTTNEIPTLESLLKKFNVDIDIWEVTNFKVNQWDTPITERDANGKVTIFTHTNYQAKASLVRKVATVCEFPTVKGAVLGKIDFNIQIPKRELKRVIILPDAQIGYRKNLDTDKLEPTHDLKAIAIVTQIIKEVKPDRVVMLGDMLDFPEWSTHFVRSPEFYFTTQPSLDYLATWIKEIRPYCKELIYIEGNHEKRILDSVIQNNIQAYNIKKANEPKSNPVLSVPHLLGLDEMKVEYIGDYPRGEYYINENLVCIHGIKVGAKSGQTVSKLLDDIRISMIQGHVHRLEMAHKTSWTNFTPKIYQAISCGCLCRIDGAVPGASARYNWQQGFGYIEHDKTQFQIDTIGIYDGKAIFKGKCYGK